MSPPESGKAPRLVESRCAYPECGRKFAYDPGDLKASSFPFCSPRCKGADLGNWVNESYRIPGMPDTRGDDEDEEEAAPAHGDDDDEEE
jgi:uncharacterized protein